MIHVLIVDDQKMFRETMEGYLQATEGYEKIGAVSSAEEAVDFCRNHQVDLILMDVCTDSNMSGFTATEKIKEESPRTKVVIVTSMLDCAFLDLARRSHADSLWYKDVSQEELMTVVEKTMGGASVFPDETPSVMIGNAKSSDFTPKELGVLRLLVRGWTYEDMALELNITPYTVKKHISSMLQKTGYTTKLRLTAEVVSKKLFVPGFDETYY